MMAQIVTLLENILSHRFGENLRLQWPRSLEGKKTHCHGVAFWRAASIFLNNTGVMWQRGELYQALTHWSSWFSWDRTCIQMQILFILLLCRKSWCLLEKKTHKVLDLYTQIFGVPIKKSATLFRAGRSDRNRRKGKGSRIGAQFRLDTTLGKLPGTVYGVQDGTRAGQRQDIRVPHNIPIISCHSSSIKLFQTCGNQRSTK